MQLVINTRGAFLKKNGQCFLVRNEENVFEVAADKVDSILVTTAATITTDAIEFAISKNIDIVFLDRFGEPYGRVWHSKLGSTALIRRRQLEAEKSEGGFRLVQEWIARKVENQMEFLKDLKKNRPDSRETLDLSIQKLGEILGSLRGISGTLDHRRGTILGYEAMASQVYFAALSEIMPEEWKFRGRSRDPARDGFNCLLNYGYGVLYSRVEKACIIAGLDPYVGFLHTDNYNKKSFVFDLIEVFRTHVDRTVVNLFSKRQVTPELFEPVPGGLTLNQEGKKVLISALNETFEKEVLYRGRKVKVKNTIPMECHRIANLLIKPGDGE